MLSELEDSLGRISADWANALLSNLGQGTTQANIALMTSDQQGLLQGFLESGELPTKVSHEFVDTVREALAGLERVAVPPEDILVALTKGGMPCTVQELLSRFRTFVDEQTKGKDANKVRIVVEW